MIPVTVVIIIVVLLLIYNYGRHHSPFVDLSLPASPIVEGSEFLGTPSKTPKKYQVFLTDTLGQGGMNYKRVIEINEAIARLGYTTWLDKKVLNGHVRAQMAERIENSQCAIVFITDEYRRKVNQVDNRDNCKYEFDYNVTKV